MLFRSLVDQLFAAPPNGLGLTYARYNIGGGDCPTCKSLSVGTAVPGYEPTAGTYDWTVDGNQRWVAQRAYQDGAVYFEAQSNSPPWWMTISGSSTGGVGGADNLSSTYQGTDANSFPSYLVNVVQHFDNDFGVTFREVDNRWKISQGFSKLKKDLLNEIKAIIKDNFFCEDHVVIKIGRASCRERV